MKRFLPSSLRTRMLGWLVLATCGAVMLSGCGSIYDVPLPGGPDVGSNPIKVRIMFRDVLDLVPQSTVKVDDVTVGKVTDIKLKGYVADVGIELPRSTDLPDNARAEIRQTSLLGEKFVSLSAPEKPSGQLGNGDVIGLDHSGRNPEVEEVLGALAALLNGGGVGQLKTIAAELNTAVGGRESDVRSVLDQIHFFMGQLAQNKASIVAAITNVNRLAVQLRTQDRSIKLALDHLPAALSSVNKQRADLIKMLNALDRLSNVGVRVIKASKEATINSLADLSPILNALAAAGSSFPKSLQVSLTYPFVDAAVGQDPQVARNLHMGDYTNLSLRMNLNLANGIPGLPGAPSVEDTCKSTKAQFRAAADSTIDKLTMLSQKQRNDAKSAVNDKIDSFDCHKLGQLNVAGLISGVLKSVLGVDPLPPTICKTVAVLCGGSAGQGTGDLGPLSGLIDGVGQGLGGATGGVLGIGRARLGTAYQKPGTGDRLIAGADDSGLAALLLTGVTS